MGSRADVSRQTSPSEVTQSCERGVATGLVAAGLLLLSGLVAAGVVVVLVQITAHRVQGAADLVAVTAAQVRNVGTGDPCAAAGRAAEADDVRLVSCSVAGDEVSFVVTVTVRGGSGRVLFGLPLTVESTSHAGVP